MFRNGVVCPNPEPASSKELSMAVTRHRFEHLVRETPHLWTGFIALRQHVFVHIVDIVSMALDFIGNEFQFSL